MKIQETDARAALLRYVKDRKPRIQADDEITIAELIAEWGGKIKINAAQAWLENEVAEGRMYKSDDTVLLNNGKRGWVYGLVKDGDE